MTVKMRKFTLYIQIEQHSVFNKTTRQLLRKKTICGPAGASYKALVVARLYYGHQRNRAGQSAFV